VAATSPETGARAPESPETASRDIIFLLFLLGLALLVEQYIAHLALPQKNIHGYHFFISNPLFM
jgi:hypothetical protein